MTTIESYTFYLADISSVYLPASLTAIMDQAFSFCYKLTSIYCKAITPPAFYGPTSFFSNVPKECVIYVPIGCKEKYQIADEWKNFTNFIEMEF